MIKIEEHHKRLTRYCDAIKDFDKWMEKYSTFDSTNNSRTFTLTEENAAQYFSIQTEMKEALNELNDIR